MKLSSESYAEPVFHLLGDGVYAAVLEQYPFPTPAFHIKKLKTDGDSLWRVSISYDLGFTENMTQRSDVLEFMIQAQAFIDTSSISTVRDTVARLLYHWAKLFPQGVPDSIF